ncbi:ribosomal protein S17E [Candidatus Nitrososphaera evergladensis SR1]|jgi:small subunit ribosomal protein S17e|uniref:30S ribosomal protein S17e n=1 Tax=Candidatus Nitrososphaera evergladensis SR1 TaxID=1459636 RepID=A0A075MTJ2_9ARCH|nr:30S ribosomal protein S17e [Candidatus Nitrososphaera evergladensis]AIF84428.1 ribosomal protein S17E [Candidatus Nitrososphaera evergladensis SR1]
MNRIKRISTELLQKYPDKFGLEFDANKKALSEVAVVKSKVLRNELAGYITSHLRKKAAQEKASSAMAEEEEAEEAGTEEESTE